MAETVRVLIGLCSYKGPDVHCFDQHYEFMHYLGRLQERSRWLSFAGSLPDGFPGLDRMAPDGLAELATGDPAFEFCTATITGHSLIGQARDLIVDRALEFGSDYVFFFDDDMIFARDTFLRLWRRNVPFVGALAFTGREPITPVLYRFKRNWNFSKQTEDVDIEPIWRYERDSLVQVDAIGTGVVLIKTDVFRRVPKPWFHGAKGAGEDIHFCWQCAKAGVPIFCDTSVKTIHKPNQPAQWMDEAYYLTKREAELKSETDNRHPDLEQLQAVGRLPADADAVRRVPVQDCCY